MGYSANINAEMARRRIRKQDVAAALGINMRTLRNKLCGKTDFTFSEVQAVRDTFFPELSLEYLFERIDD
jgi:predicted transcriptional regulator